MFADSDLSDYVQRAGANDLFDSPQSKTWLVVVCLLGAALIAMAGVLAFVVYRGRRHARGGNELSTPFIVHSDEA